MVKLPQDALDRSPEEGARRIALGYLEDARAALARLDDAEDAEALHDFRVAIRRLRSTVRLWRPELRSVFKRGTRQTLRELQQASGVARDAEVALAWLEAHVSDLRGRQRAGARWLMERLALRAKPTGGLLDTLREVFAPLDAELAERLPRFEVELDLRGGPEPRRFGSELSERAREACEHAVESLASIRGAEDRETAHAARIACKRLRYLVEPVAELASEATPLVKLCKQLQDALGDLNDAHNLLDELQVALRVAAEEQAERLHALAREGDAAGLRRELGAGPRAGLLELTTRVHARIAEIDRDGPSHWGGERQQALGQAVERLSAQLGVESYIERERKYVLDGMPELPPGAEVLEVEQGWLPGEVVRERLRRQSSADRERFLRTVKLGSGLQRFEFEEEIEQALFDALWPATGALRIRKRRYRVPQGEHVWEIDEFLDRDLVLAEVELDAGCDGVELPDWLAACNPRDVTDDPAYTNWALARDHSAH
jgi:CHAD domain-containing protein/CYTH domain-containing protein